MTKKAIHPDEVYQSLLDRGGRVQRRRNLEILHRVCAEQQGNGSKDFSISTIGWRSEERGGIGRRTLYTEQSADYRVLIEAWATYVGPALPAGPTFPASYAFLMKIEDPAMRSIVQGIISERDRLQAQVNLLKSKTHITIDRRPLGATGGWTAPSETMAVLPALARLTPSEKEALGKALSPRFLEDEGWVEGPQGQIVNDRGRTLYDPGYTTGLRKLLEDSE